VDCQARGLRQRLELEPEAGMGNKVGKDPLGSAPVGSGRARHESSGCVSCFGDVRSDGRRQVDEGANKLAMGDVRVEEIAVVFCSRAQSDADDGRGVGGARAGHVEPGRELVDAFGGMHGDGAVGRMIHSQAEKLLKLTKAPKLAFGAKAGDDAGFERRGATAQDAVVDVDAEDSKVGALVAHMHTGVRGKRAQSEGLQVGAKLKREVATALFATVERLAET